MSAVIGRLLPWWVRCHGRQQAACRIAGSWLGLGHLQTSERLHLQKHTHKNQTHCHNVKSIHQPMTDCIGGDWGGGGTRRIWTQVLLQDLQHIQHRYMHAHIPASELLQTGGNPAIMSERAAPPPSQTLQAKLEEMHFSLESRTLCHSEDDWWFWAYIPSYFMLISCCCSATWNHQRSTAEQITYWAKPKNRKEKKWHNREDQKNYIQCHCIGGTLSQVARYGIADFFFSKYWNRKLNSCKTVDSECKTAALFSYKISKVKTVWWLMFTFTCTVQSASIVQVWSHLESLLECSV